MPNHCNVHLLDSSGTGPDKTNLPNKKKCMGATTDCPPWAILSLASDGAWQQQPSTNTRCALWFPNSHRCTPGECTMLCKAQVCPCPYLQMMWLLCVERWPARILSTLSLDGWMQNQPSTKVTSCMCNCATTFFNSHYLQVRDTHS